MRFIMRVALTLLVATFFTSTVWANVSGAIFTTDKYGIRVNANIYPNKDAVYLDGGPGPNAPLHAAALPDDKYFFQVTDPSGKTLLSQDGVENRWFVIEGGRMVACSTTHIKGSDTNDGGITVQLMPYKNTPNNGGVYKVWATPCSKYNEYKAFVPAWCKTDNFKVKGKLPCLLKIRKFLDKNANGCWDAGEPEIGCSELCDMDGEVAASGGGGWPIWITDPCGVINNYYTPACPLVYPGEWTVRESVPPHWLQTALIVDGKPICPPTPCYKINICEGETHEIIFGNVKLGCIIGKKWYDKDCDKEYDKDCDKDEVPIQGWKLELIGPIDHPIFPCKTRIGCTDKWGIYCWEDLYPGKYILREIFPCDPGWKASTDTEFCIDLPCRGFAKRAFGNFYVCPVDFNTKGFWHNKNGLLLETEADIAFVNGLEPYKAPSSYFDAGDEPFDGKFVNGNPVEAAFSDDRGELIAPAGSWKAEVSLFLVDRNAGSDPREQLAQQLLAFIFNCRHPAGGLGAVIQVNGQWVKVADIIDYAIRAWKWEPGYNIALIQPLLDQLNNNDAVPCVPCNPPGVVYP